MSAFYDFRLTSIDGKEIPFSDYKGKKVLIVNVASECGYTPQYEHLQAFHEKYGKEVVVLGVPANNFGGQEPGSNDQIASFCQQNYGVKFQMFGKISVVGNDQHPLYKWLEAEITQAPTWNFCKYLINENGTVEEFFPANISPFDEAILKYVENTALQA